MKRESENIILNTLFQFSVSICHIFVIEPPFRANLLLCETPFRGLLYARTCGTTCRCEVGSNWWLEACASVVRAAMQGVEVGSVPLTPQPVLLNNPHGWENVIAYDSGRRSSDSRDGNQ